jgi:hypothetical protein
MGFGGGGSSTPAANSITTAMLQAGIITNPKIANGAVNTSDLASDVYQLPCPLDGKPVMLAVDNPSPSLALNFKDLAANGPMITELTEMKWPFWFKNFSQNVDTIRKGLDLNNCPRRKGPALVVGAGPSIERYKHLRMIAENRDKIGTLISTDKMLKPLLEHKVTPDFVVSVDGDPTISKFYKLPQELRKAKVDAVLDAVTIHPQTVKMAQRNLGGKIWWFVHFVDNPSEERCSHCRRLSTTAGFHFMSGEKMMIQASGNCGALGWHLASFLECNPIVLVGMDYSYPADQPIEETMYYNSYVAMTGGNRDQAKNCFETHTNPWFKNEHNIDVVWHTYRNVLMSFVKAAYPKFTTINATGGGSLYEDPIVSMDFKEALGKIFK